MPFAATGAIGLLLITGVPLGLPSLIGMLMLVGIVVTNAIVLIDLINQYRQPRNGEPGMNVADAITHGARQRLRPILMTALATVFALTPMALGLTGGGGFISQPLAIVVIGGLISSTALTLVLVPVLYRLVEGRRERKALAKAATEAGPGPGRAGPVTAPCARPAAAGRPPGPSPTTSRTTFPRTPASRRIPLAAAGPRAACSPDRAVLAARGGAASGARPRRLPGRPADAVNARWRGPPGTGAGRRLPCGRAVISRAGLPAYVAFSGTSSPFIRKASAPRVEPSSIVTP